MKILFTIAFCSLLSLPVLSQTAVLKGRISQKGGESVSFVTVQLAGTTTAVMTDDHGNYELKNIPFGKKEIVVSSVEIETKKVHVDINKNEIKLDIEVNPRTDVDLDEVKVVGKTQKKALETDGFAVAIIETKEASLRNLTTNELLDRAVGVRVRQNGGIGSQVEYNLNGMSGSAIGIFIDGIEASTYGQSFNLNNIPPAMIERIEVYKGILPSHLTGDYVGGAINVVLKKDVSHNNATIAVSYGSFNTLNVDIGVTMRHKKTGLSFRGSGFYTYTDNSYTTWGRSTTHVNEFQQITRPYRAKRFNNTYESIGARFEVGFTDTKWADLFFLGYNVSDNYNEIPHGITMATPYVGRFNETNANVFSLNYSKRNLLIKDLTFNINAVYSSRGTYLQDTVSTAYNWDGKPREVIVFGERVPMKTQRGAQQGLPTMNQTDRKITNIRANLSYMIASGHRLSINNKFESTRREDRDELSPTMVNLGAESIISKNIVSMNYEAQTFKSKLKTNLLGKYTTNYNNQKVPYIVNIEGVNKVVIKDTSTFRSNFGYGATVSYNLAPQFFIIASMENSFVMPNEIQMYGDPTTNILPNVDLKAEKNVNYNLGLRYGMKTMGKYKFSLYANAFWRNGHDKITQRAVSEDEIREEADADIQTTKYVNLGMTQSRGFEAEIIYIYNNKLNTSFNFSKFNNLFKQSSDENGNAHAFYGFQVPNEPFFTINSNIQYRFDSVFQRKSVLNAYYNTGYVGEYYIVWGQPEWSLIPAQFTHDMGASYRFPKGKLVASVDMKNMFNAEIYDNFAIQKPGRSIFFKLNYTLGKF